MRNHLVVNEANEGQGKPNETIHTDAVEHRRCIRGDEGDATVRFDIWDTADQERYHSLSPVYYHGAAAAVIVYDISSTAGFVHPSKEVGRQASETREPIFGDGVSGQQGRFGREEKGRDTAGSVGVR